MKGELTVRNVFTRERLLRLLPYFVLLAVFLPIHLLANPLYGDDVMFSQVLSQQRLWPWLFSRYGSTSSRLVIESVMIPVLSLPKAVWVVLDLGMIWLAFWSLCRLLIPQENLKRSLLLALLLCCYPFAHMASAGWRTTTINYLWPFACLLFALSLAQDQYRKGRLKGAVYPLFYLALLFATSHELVAVLALGGFGVAWVLSIRKQKTKWLVLSAMLLAAAQLLLILLSPGNLARLSFEEAKWYPGYNSFPFWQKLRIGLVSTWDFLIALPNVLLLLLGLGVLLRVCQREGAAGWQKGVSAVPLAVSAALMAYCLIAGPLGLPRADHGGFQGVLMLSFGVFALTLIPALWWALPTAMERAVSLGALAGGFACRMSLLLSPTVIASGARTYLFLYMGMLVADFYLIRGIRPGKGRWAAFALLALGVLVNLYYVYLHP